MKVKQMSSWRRTRYVLALEKRNKVTIPGPVSLQRQNKRESICEGSYLCRPWTAHQD